ncbi:hypothetical protein T261_6873 [Streptomyces lydicus]|nr:hypothetical protein T261_6873 [Streptomyces lydicus]
MTAPRISRCPKDARLDENLRGAHSTPFGRDLGNLFQQVPVHRALTGTGPPRSAPNPVSAILSGPSHTVIRDIRFVAAARTDNRGRPSTFPEEISVVISANATYGFFLGSWWGFRVTQFHRTAPVRLFLFQRFPLPLRLEVILTHRESISRSCACRDAYSPLRTWFAQAAHVSLAEECSTARFHRQTPPSPSRRPPLPPATHRTPRRPPHRKRSDRPGRPRATGPRSASAAQSPLTARTASRAV